MVLHEHRHVVATAQADGAVEVREPVGVGLELGKRQLLAGRRHDEGRTVGMLFGVDRCVHGAERSRAAGSTYLVLTRNLRTDR